jgi:DNA-binding transcriptional ArsR family regulator
MPAVELKNNLKVQKQNSNGHLPRMQGSCKVICFNVEKVNEVKRSLPTEKEFEKLTGLYAALGNVTRLKIIFALAKGELCVCDVANVLELSIPATSHQLKYLYEHKLLKYRNDGKMVYYSLNSEQLVNILKEDVKFIEDALMD